MYIFFDFIYNIFEKLYFQFGHLLQVVLCQVHYAEVSGLSNVEWDAVGITNHFMTHWYLLIYSDILVFI